MLQISAQRVDWPNASYVTVDASAAKLDPRAKNDSESVFATDAVLKVMRDEVDALRSKREEYNLDGQGLERMHKYVEGLAEKANLHLGDAPPLEAFTVDGKEMMAYVLDHSFLGSTLNSDPTGGSFWSCALVGVPCPASHPKTLAHCQQPGASATSFSAAHKIQRRQLPDLGAALSVCPRNVTCFPGAGPLQGAGAAQGHPGRPPRVRAWCWSGSVRDIGMAARVFRGGADGQGADGGREFEVEQRHCVCVRLPIHPPDRIVYRAVDLIENRRNILNLKFIFDSVFAACQPPRHHVCLTRIPNLVEGKTGTRAGPKGGMVAPMVVLW